MIRYTDIDVNESAARILQIYSLASEKEKDYGRVWYNLACDYASTLAQRYDLSLAQSAGIIAALSPSVGIARNLLEASLFIESAGSARVSTYPAMIDKAERILSGKDPNSVLGTKKVYAFFCNIVNPDTAGRVTVDRHSARVAIDPAMSAESAFYYTNTDRKYQTMEKCYRVAADYAGILPHALQSITWVTYRRLYIKKVDHYALFDL